MLRTVFTIGHSTHSQERLIALLQQHAITALCDVRSQPYSRVNPQFNHKELKHSLRAHRIAYVFLGKELGARSEDSSCYDHGRVRYDRLAETELFRQGLGRVREGLKRYRIALMCAEKEPLDCHRTILVAKHLMDSELEVLHIHADGRIESHTDALNRLVGQLNLLQRDIFHSREDLIAEAYRIQEDRIAYSKKDTEDTTAHPIRSATA
jgi:uncharacterized protein (DUF488 family)